VRIVRSNGHYLEGKLTQFADDSLQLERFGDRLTVSKPNVSQVYYLRYKPLSDSEKYSVQEDFWYDPRLWPYYLKLAPKIPVRLFDSSLAEDNTVPRCSPKDY